jgi:hypothetical protein
MKKYNQKNPRQLRLMIKRIFITIIFLDIGLFLLLPLGRTNANIMVWLGSADITAFLLIFTIIISLFPMTNGKYRFVPRLHKTEEKR